MSAGCQLEQAATKKIVAHVLKHHQNSVIGLLLGKRDGSSFMISDAIPLFHERIMACALETAFEMVDANLPAGSQIVGLYEAPLNFKADESNPLTTLGQNIAEVIKST
mmetsp:Transcript_43483/g.31301  ORF Transcript_43483/g.31301 Transcript_43483/m.31301 type:complete len:108 (+) Transcript_43483:23-346(+)|eukprot:CAMPEP_0116886194 /NCGR_PEP_ID=MMETSP0463-20121206/19910_1 /TAXON_ID=181622 /ORGANISM="Strombidinopsis sp, Strain SopsisLIS2011" /LENGTH=107 /DNA_ID=CAMNT_0004546103 /DNA_START=7 /DNA_END=330 /DNA_ORIENTATION=-